MRPNTVKKERSHQCKTRETHVQNKCLLWAENMLIILQEVSHFMHFLYTDSWLSRPKNVTILAATLSLKVTMMDNVLNLISGRQMNVQRQY